MTPCALALCTAATLGLAGAAAAADGLVPITTASTAAREAYLRGRDLLERLRGQEARADLEEAVAADPDFAMAYLALAQSATSAREFFDNAERAAALADRVSAGERLWILGFEAGAKGLVERQRELYSQLAVAFPQDPRVHNQVGLHHFGQQDWAAAAAAFEKATALAPDYAPPYNMLGYARRFAGDFAGAEAAFQTYIERIPNDPNPYDSYAELQLKMGRYEASIATYRKALEQDEHFFASRLGIATDLNYLGRHDEARSELADLLALARNDGELRAAWFAIAVSHLDEGDVEAAIARIGVELALAAAADDAVAMAGDHANMGLLNLEAGRVGAAQAHFAAALAVVEASGRDEAVKAQWRRGDLYNRGRLAVARGDQNGARALAAQLLSESEAIGNLLGQRLAHELTGIAALADGDGDGARQALARANQEDPYNLYRQALACTLAGDAAGVRQWLQRTVDYNGLNNLSDALVRSRARALLAQ